jgi:hypothetical protein
MVAVTADAESLTIAMLVTATATPDGDVYRVVLRGCCCTSVQGYGCVCHYLYSFRDQNCRL